MAGKGKHREYHLIEIDANGDIIDSVNANPESKSKTLAKAAKWEPHGRAVTAQVEPRDYHYDTDAYGDRFGTDIDYLPIIWEYQKSV